jgi:hypothetical protein
VNTTAVLAAAPLSGWRLALRVLLVASPPVLLGLWLSMPSLQPEPFTQRGVAELREVCTGPFCGQLLVVNGQPLACRIDIVGLPGRCGLRGGGAGGGLAGQEVQALAVRLPSVLGLLGQARAEGVLLRLERGDQLLFRRDLRAQAWGALYGGWLFHAIYWPLAGLLLWLWPGSGAARRLWARITWSQLPK